MPRTSGGPRRSPASPLLWQLTVPALMVAGGGVFALWRWAGKVAGPGTAGAYALFAVVLAFAVAALAAGVVAVRRRGGGPVQRVRRESSARAVAARAAHLRPDLGEAATAADAGIALGRLAVGWPAVGATPVLATVEDGTFVVGPPRSRKTTNVVAPAVLDWPGPAVVTSIRPDLAAWTAAARERGHGRVWVWNPWHDVPPVGEPLRWDPTVGAEDPATALRRGNVLAAAVQVGAGTENGSDWRSVSASVLAAYLHAAAVSGASMREILGWAGDPADPTPVNAIRLAGLDTQLWAQTLSRYSGEDPRMRANVFFGVRLALRALWDPAALAAVCPPAGEGFDPAALLDGGTVYVLGNPTDQEAVAPLTALLVDEIVDVALRRAAGRPGGRLAPPLGLLLDETANIAPLPRLPDLFSYGGGGGVYVMAVFQSLFQARQRFGDDATAAMWDASTYKLWLPGNSSVKDLDDISRLAGEFDEPTANVYTRGGLAGALGGPDQVSESVRRRRVLDIDEIRNARPGTGLLLPRAAPPVWVDLNPVYGRRDGDRLQADHDAYYASLHPAARP